jgi:ATP phosphoribosyltransferase
MKTTPRLKIAIQKSGRLNADSLDLLVRCGLKIRVHPNSLLCHGENLPIDVLFVRDDDIPTLVMDGICDLGIVGENVLLEKTGGSHKSTASFNTLKTFGFGLCRLSIAVPEGMTYTAPSNLNGLKIVTSYPNLLQEYLTKHHIQAHILTISGSVEIAPRVGMADAICDLVSTGRTLEEHGLKEVAEVIKTQAVLIQTTHAMELEKTQTLELLMRRMDGVLQAQESKYIMFHAPKSALEAIKKMLPGFESPTIMPLEGVTDKVAVHAVSSEGVFWNTLEKLKQAGASSILVLPIEKMMN